LKWRNEGAEGDDSGVGEKSSHFRHAADVLLSVLGGEAQVLVQPVADVVAVQTVGGDTSIIKITIKI